MSLAADKLWGLTVPGRQVDPNDLLAVLEDALGSPSLDFRTTLLIRDSLSALKAHWGDDRFSAWLAASPRRNAIVDVLRSDLGPSGFPSLEKRLMEKTRSEVVQQFLRELGLHVDHPARLEIGGSIALILSGNLSRMTEDIDVVDEVPVQLRSQHALLDELALRYNLRLTHFQSHFLPAGWADRLRSLGRYGQLDVFLVDACDIFVGKLFSARVKDRDDLRALAPLMDNVTLAARLRDFAGALLAEPDLAANARRNWYILYNQPLEVIHD